MVSLSLIVSFGLTVLVVRIHDFVLTDVSTASQDHTRLVRLHEDLLELIHDEIQLEVTRLAKLEKLLEEVRSNQDSLVTRSSASLSSGDLNPVDYLVMLHRAILLASEFGKLLDHGIDDSENSSKLNETLKRDGESYNKHLIEHAESLLRFQRFYGIGIDHIMRAETGLESRTDEQPNYELRMNWKDCSLMGLVAYNNDLFDLATLWFQAAIDLANTAFTESKLDEKISGPTDTHEHDEWHDKMVVMLDYLAFSAYNEGKLDIAIEATKTWLRYEPNNERASSNLELYLEELNETVSVQDTTRADVINKFYSLNGTMDLEYYEPSDDLTIRTLCRERHIPNSKDTRCSTRFSLTGPHLSPELRLEVLNIEPKIVRIHDIISEQEAKLLHKLALPKLKRSTVTVEDKAITSKFRTAKTAWMSASEYPIIDKIERRLEHILKLNLNDSEPIQVVNYRFGGFYGPHLDTMRSETDSDHDKWSISERMMTILIYLNHVSQGGSTVFPRINLTVEPIERTAVVWPNLQHDGQVDPRTLHTGCPVFSGSKWIATKWPRDTMNREPLMCQLKSRQVAEL